MAGVAEGFSLGMIILAQASGIGSRYRVDICGQAGGCICSRTVDGRKEKGRNIVKASELVATRDGECSDLVGPKDLFKADLDGANLESAGLDGARMRGARLRDANMSYAHLEEAHLEGVRALGADFDSAQLGWTTFDEDSELVGARLIGAHLDSAFMNGADLRWACLRGATLTGAHLRGADLRGANLEAYTLRFADLAGAIFDRNTQWPDEITPEVAVDKLHMVQSEQDAPVIENPPCKPLAPRLPRSH